MITAAVDLPKYSTFLKLERTLSGKSALFGFQQSVKSNAKTMDLIRQGSKFIFFADHFNAFNVNIFFQILFMATQKTINNLV